MSAVLEIRGVSVERGGRPVTSEVDIAVGAGAITALVGPNGAGKSSLVAAIAGEAAYEGIIAFDGAPLAGRMPDAIRRAGIAAVPEGHRILAGMSVADNLAAAAAGFVRSERSERIAEALAALPELERLLDRRGGLLSGGEQQMVAVAQALVARPRVLVIDELSLGLAPLIVDRLIRVLVELADAGTAVLLIEQFTVKALAVATEAYVLSGGQVRFAGAAQTLSGDPSILQAAYLATTAIS